MGVFLFAMASRPVPGPKQPPIQWERGIRSPEAKRAGREVISLLPIGNCEVLLVSIYKYPGCAWSDADVNAFLSFRNTSLR